MQIYQMPRGKNEVEQESKARLDIAPWIQSKGVH